MSDDAWTEDRPLDMLEHTHVESGQLILRRIQSPDRSRVADAIGVNTSQARGTGLEGHEVKIGRSDWARDRDTGAKAEAWARHCRRWWIVAPRGLIRPGELPLGWGLLEPARTKLKVAVDAEIRETEPFTNELLVRLVRRSAQSHESYANSRCEAGRRAGLAEHKESSVVRREHERAHELEEKLRRQRALVAAFEAAAGIRIDELTQLWREEPERAAEIGRQVASSSGLVRDVRKIAQAAVAVLSSIGELPRELDVLVLELPDRHDSWTERTAAEVLGTAGSPIQGGTGEST